MRQHAAVRMPVQRGSGIVDVIQLPEIGHEVVRDKVHRLVLLIHKIPQPDIVRGAISLVVKAERH